MTNGSARGAIKDKPSAADRPFFPPAIDPAASEKCKHTAFAAVIRARDECDVLQADHQHQRPEDQREHPKHRGFGYKDLQEFRRGKLQRSGLRRA